MSDTLTRCEHDGLRWYPEVTVEKYSADQTSWAEARLAEGLSWRRLPVLRRHALGDRRITVAREELGTVRRLHGDWLRTMFPAGPEDGYARCEGNILVNTGLTNIINLLVGTAQSNSVRTATNAQTVIGVGNSATAATTADVHLGADGASAFYQGADATFPSLTAPATINNQSTFASGSANFAWNEWCWVTGTGTVVAGATLASVFGTSGASAPMWNHKVPASSLGTKASGASWVFSTTIVFS